MRLPANLKPQCVEATAHPSNIGIDKAVVTLAHGKHRGVREENINAYRVLCCNCANA